MNITRYGNGATRRNLLKLIVVALVAYNAICFGGSLAFGDDSIHLQQFFAAQEAQGTRFLDPQRDAPLGRVVKYDQNPILLGPTPTEQGTEICHPQVWNESGTLYMSYVHYATGVIAPPTTASLDLATSTDGLNWTKAASPILTPSSTGWDNWRVGYHSMVKVGSTYYLYYTGMDSTAHNWDGIGVATSTDLTHWTKYSANPLLTPLYSGYEQTSILEPYVFIDSGTWYMYYMGRNNGNLVGNIMLATSSDGINWQRQAEPVLRSDPNSWDSQEIAPPGHHQVRQRVLHVLHGGP